MTATKNIQNALGLNDLDYDLLVYDVYLAQAMKYFLKSYYAPQYIQEKAGKDILAKSSAFRVWFIGEKEKNDLLIWEFFGIMTNAKKTPNLYFELQDLYFDERGVFPDKSIIEAAVQNYKNRVANVCLN